MFAQLFYCLCVCVFAGLFVCEVVLLCDSCVNVVCVCVFLCACVWLCVFVCACAALCLCAVACVCGVCV